MENDESIKTLIRQAITLSGGMYKFMDILYEVASEHVAWLRDHEMWRIEWE